MNDNFARMTDAGYAYAERLTYIKELETLNINVVDLLLGISLRFENHSDYHYFGAVDRLGRAITESAYQAEFKAAITAMIEDQELDTYNRMAAYFLLANYTAHLADAEEREAHEKLLAELQAHFPPAMRE